MKTKDINVRDPFILPFENVYYMYAREKNEGMAFCVYKSSDLENWSEPEYVFENSEDFWGEKDFWAPEVHEYRGKFYMFASFKSENHVRATHILVSDKPDGKFVPLTKEPITPSDWECLDGTLYIDKKGKPHIVFCHEWSQIGDGTVCETELSEDLKTVVGEPRLLWKASDCPKVKDISRGSDTGKVTDGPFMHRMKNGDLICTWSSFTENSYSVISARSDNGDIDGNWTIDEALVSAEDGGHGMIFKTFEGKDMFVLHRPNYSLEERAVFFEVVEENGGIKLKK